jgi:predicted dithiol-disulfide oxidoreductase (DUF899 family)
MQLIADRGAAARSPQHEPGASASPRTRACLDLTALGRQEDWEDWEDSPEGYPQTAPYSRWRWHDAYSDATPATDQPGG